jgi:hypothetical protein
MAESPNSSDGLTSIPVTQLDRRAALLRGLSPTPARPSAPQGTPIAAKDDELAQLERDQRIKEIQHKLRMQELAEAKAQAELDAIRRQGNTTQGIRDDDETETGEKYPHEVLQIVQQTPGVAPKDIHLILTHKFNPYNLTRLRSTIGARPREQQDVTRIDSTTQQLVLKRTVGTIKDFGNDPLVWVECFSNYARIIGLLFGAKHPRIMPAMAHFLSRVVRHAHDYEWQSVLEFALHRHEQAAALQILDPDAWEKVPEEWNAHYFNPTTLRMLSNKRPKTSQGGRATSPSSPRVSPNDNSVTCDAYNSVRGCAWERCKRRHACKRCDSNTHGAANCNKK